MLVGPSGCGKSTTLAHDRRPRGDHRRRHRDRRRDRQRRAAQGPRHRHGVPELRALPAHDRLREHVVRPAPQENPEGRDQAARRARRAHPRHHRAARPQAASSSRAASASASPWAAPSCAIPRCSCSTSRCRNLDAKLRVQMRTEIKKVHQKVRTTTVYVTHDQVEAMTLADRVVVMNAGRIEQVGTPQRSLSLARRPIRGGLHRLAGDELHPLPARAGGGRARPCASATSSSLPGAGRAHRRATGRMSASRSWSSACGPSTSPRPGRIVEPGTAEFAMPIDVVEPMGMETMVYFTVNGTRGLRPGQSRRRRGAGRAHALHGRSQPHAPDRPDERATSSRRPPLPGPMVPPRCRLRAPGPQGQRDRGW